MSAFGTKKAGGDLALQLTFPEVFSAAVASRGKNPYGVLQSTLKFGQDLPEGKDLQSAWHEQKLADANRMAMAKVQATKSALEKWWHHTAPSNYIKPVLAQRKVANPSTGNQVDIYAARDERPLTGGCACDGGDAHSDSGSSENSYDRGKGMKGGVLRTAQGQKFGHKMMMNRVGQLNAIDMAKTNFAVGMPTPTGTNKNLTPNVKLSTADDALTALDSLYEFVSGNKDADFYTPYTMRQIQADATRARDLIKNGIASYTKDDYDDVFFYVIKLSAEFDAMRRESGEDFNRHFAQSILDGIDEMYENLVDFGKEMVKHLGESDEQKVALVKELIKKYKLGPLKKQDRASFRRQGLEFSEANQAPLRPLPPPPAPPAPPAPLLPGQVVGQGRKKNWIQKAISHPGALTKLAKRHGETAEDFAEEVLSHPKQFAKTTRKRAQLAKTLKGFRGGEDAHGRREDAPAHGLDVTYGAQYNPRAFNDNAHFSTDNRTKFGNQSGAYLGESIGKQVAVQNVPIPVEPDGTYVHPTTGYTMPVFPNMPISKKPSNTMKPRPQAPLPMFQDSASGIFSAPRLKMPPVMPKVPNPPIAYGKGKAKPECPTCGKHIAHRGACPKAR